MAQLADDSDIPGDHEGNRTCRDCGAAFIVFASERAGFLAKGLAIPRRCKTCRARRRRERDAGEMR